MYLETIKEFNKNLTILQNGEFLSLGFDLRKPYPKMLTYASNKYFFEECLRNENVSCIIATKSIIDDSKKNINKGIVLSQCPEIDFYEFHNYLTEKTDFYQSDFELQIGTNCKISSRAIIPERNVCIGNNVIIEENVIIRENVLIGNNTIIRAGTIIGGEGFQFPFLSNKIIKVHHVGGVKIGNNVEIQQLVAIDRHIFNDFTVIGNESKLDNFVYIAHGVKLGKRCRCGGHSVILGSTILGDDIWIGPSATISSTLMIGNMVRINIGSVVTTNLPDGSHVSGNFAINHKKFINHIKKIR